MFLALNFGNSNVQAGLFAPGRAAAPVADSRFALEAFPVALADWLAKQQAKVTQTALATVRPAGLQGILDAWPVGLPAPEVVERDFPVPMENRTEVPSQVGVDRLLNAWMGFRITGAATIVADLGTAVTLDVVDDEGNFLGGVIAPGMRAALNGLLQAAPRLPRIDSFAQGPTLGRTTEEALRAGVVQGTQGMILHCINGIDRELGRRHELLLTGGDAAALAEPLGWTDKIIPTLTLQAIHQIHGSKL